MVVGHAFNHEMMACVLAARYDNVNQYGLANLSRGSCAMTDPTRRMFNQGALGSLLTFSLLESLFCRDAFADEI